MRARWPLAAGLLLLVGLGVLIGVTTPWHVLPGQVPGGAVHPDAATDFTALQIRRATTYHDTIRPWGLADLSVGIAVPVVLGFSPLGRWLLRGLDRRRWLLRVAAAVVAVTASTLLVRLPIAAREHAIEHRYGLSVQGWASWWGDVGRGYLVTVVTTTLAVVVLCGLAHRWRRSWWLPAAGIGALLVVAGSFVYPYTVQPLFTTTTSLPAGPLRTSLLAMAARDGQPLTNILVAHEASRTTSENAYVSGFGASRRLVLYDTLLHDDTTREIEALTAHELGHSKHHDVLRGTVEGALGVGGALCLAGVIFSAGAWWPRTLRADGMHDPRIIPALLATYTVLAFAVSPLVNVVSRRVEARADLHSLQLDRDPTAFVAAQRKLAVSGLDDLTPSRILIVLFTNHPTAPSRIAMARDWAKQHHVPVPPPVAAG
jgi:STE24 endopeptidase